MPGFEAFRVKKQGMSSVLKNGIKKQIIHADEDAKLVTIYHRKDTLNVDITVSFINQNPTGHTDRK
ncbi:MAG: hypothetical protein ISN64_00560 [Rickettsia sp.]|nr:hypothetical protein [Rickettsia sp.]